MNPLLDIEVAEKVMGWEPLCGEEAIRARAREYKRKGGHFSRLWVVGDERMACEQCGDMPAFSTDIAEAWRVVERMRELGYDVLIDYARRWPKSWHVGIQGCLFDATTAKHGYGTTAPEAICRAALAAITASGPSTVDSAPQEGK